MKRTTVKLKLVAIEPGRFVDATGYEISIPGYEDFRFAVYHPIVNIEGEQAGEDWVVSELSTGCQVSLMRSTRIAAVENAKYRLDVFNGRNRLIEAGAVPS